MRKVILINLLIIGVINTSCNSTETKNEQNTLRKENLKITDSITDFNESFEGTINNKYSIVMNLTNRNKNLIGTYQYKSQGKPIKIVGKINDNGDLTINEFNEKGNITGIFTGQLIKTNITGKWEKPDGSKSMSFSISLCSKTESKYSNKNSNNSDEYLNWTGTYKDQFGRSLKIIGPESDGAIKFELTPKANENCQEGSTSGIAYLTSSAVANYSSDQDECHLNFTFNPGKIEVKEYDCSHGSACGTFEGYYKK